MIIYNIRANGPYEYDKLILNIGQLHNEYLELQHAFEDSELEEQNDILTQRIKEYTQHNGLLNRIALIKKVVL